MSGRNDKTWREIIEEPIVQEFIDAKNNRLEQIWRGKLLGGYKRYITNKRKGDYTYMVDEWDKFELERERHKINDMEDNKIKGEVIMSKSRVLVRLTKNYNVVEVERSEISDANDFVIYKQWAFDEAYETLQQIPDSGFSTPRAVEPQQYVKETKPVKPYEPKPKGAFVTKADINPGVRLSDGQKGVAVKRINKGELTLEQVNSIQNYDEVQAVLFGK